MSCVMALPARDDDRWNALVLEKASFGTQVQTIAVNFISALWLYPISALASVVVVAFAVKVVIGFIQGPQKTHTAQVIGRPRASFNCFFSGVLFVNALAHFSHGISGERFPAPFGHLLGSGFPQHLSNVLWGFINAVLGYSLFVRGEVVRRRSREIAFFCGVLAMGIFLSFIFSRFPR
jgi:hypothetical protein